MVKLISNLVLMMTLGFAPLTGIHAQHSDSMGMKTKSEEQIGEIREHLKEMETLMMQIQEESDPQKRAFMLETHAKEMEEMVVMMGGEGHKNMMGMERMDADEKMQEMEERMAIMEEMMEQVMGHTVENSKKLHEHKK